MLLLNTMKFFETISQEVNNYPASYCFLAAALIMIACAIACKKTPQKIYLRNNAKRGAVTKPGTI